MSITNTLTVVTAAETEERAMIASAAFATGHFRLAAHVPELVRSGASAHQIVEQVWSEMCSQLDATASLSRIGPSHEGAE